MRVAVLLDPSAESVPVDSLAGPGTRLVLLPKGDRLTHALVRAMRAYGADETSVIVVAPVGEGVVDAGVWSDRLSPAVTAVDDDAVVDARIAEASRALDEARLDEAWEAYVRCEALLSDEMSPRRAEVLTCLAQIADARGDEQEAITRLDQALAVYPTHKAALEMRWDLAHRLGHSATAAAMAKRLLAFATGDAERVDLLMAAADDGLRVGVDMLTAALRIRPGNRELLDRLRAVYEASGDWARSVDVAVAFAEGLADPQARARALVAAAETSATKAKKVDRAVALYEAAITDDPEVPGAFDAIERVLVQARDYRGVERAYVRQLERLKGRHAAEAVVLDKLARVREEHLDDAHGAIAALDRLAVLQPEDVETRVRLARLLEVKGQDELAVACLEIAAHAVPARPDVFHALSRVLRRLGSVDRAYCACGVLVHLGEADLDEQLTYQQFVPDAVVRPAKPVGEEGWRALLPEDLDTTTTDLLAAIAPAAIGARIADLRAKKKLPALDPKDRQDVERSTVSAVRTVGWVCKLFGIPCPAVYAAASEVPGGVGVLAAIEPAIALGPSLLSGRSPGELAFLLAREVVVLRLTSRLLAFYPTFDDRRALTAAVAQDVGSKKGDLAIDPAQRAAISTALRAVAERGGQIDLLGWLRAVERAACRAGLLACGDVTVAARVLAIDTHLGAGMSAAERLRDLVPYSVSESYATLRQRIGIAARASRPA
jgi:tetratricopeptide (TPR) repeat protein